MVTTEHKVNQSCTFKTRGLQTEPFPEKTNTTVAKLKQLEVLVTVVWKAEA